MDNLEESEKPDGKRMTVINGVVRYMTPKEERETLRKRYDEVFDSIQGALSEAEFNSFCKAYGETAI